MDINGVQCWFSSTEHSSPIWQIGIISTCTTDMYKKKKLLTARVGFRRVAWRSGPIDFHFLKEKREEEKISFDLNFIEGFIYTYTRPLSPSSFISWIHNRTHAKSPHVTHNHHHQGTKI